MNDNAGKQVINRLTLNTKSQMKILASSMVLSLLIFSACSDAKKGDSGSTDTSSTETADTTAAEKPTPTLDSSATASAEYFMPSPGEIFSAMNKLDEVNWMENATLLEENSFEENDAQSFWMGVCVADAFMAIQAKDNENLSDMNMLIFDFAKNLGIEESLEESRNKLEEMNTNQNWESLTSGVDNVYTDFINGLDSVQGGDKLLAYSSLGGWAEGVQVIGTHVSNNFNQESAKLLFADNVVNELVSRMEGLSVDDEAQKTAILDELTKIQTVIADNSDNITKESVDQLVAGANSILSTMKS